MRKKLTVALAAPLLLLASACATEADQGAVPVRAGAANEITVAAHQVFFFSW